MQVCWRPELIPGLCLLVRQGSAPRSLETMATTYVLVISCGRAVVAQVGALGAVALAPGWYLYVGSARRHLAARLARHQRRQKRRHWQIDYLLLEAAVALTAIWVTAAWGECDLARRLLALPQVTVPHPRLGASDCRCPAHFCRWQDSLPALIQTLRALGLSRYPPP
jgi:Uri superfamily endonuclease